MCQRRETVQHPFGTMKARMGNALVNQDASRVSAEMALAVLAYKRTRVMNIGTVTDDRLGQSDLARRELQKPTTHEISRPRPAADICQSRC